MANNKGKQVAGEYTGKGKEVAGNVTGKRKSTEKAGGRSKRNRGVVKFFEVDADEVDGDVDDDDDDSDFDYWDFFNYEFEGQSSKINKEPGKAQSVPFFLEDEELSEGELEKMVEERYGPDTNYVTYADDRINTNISVDENGKLPSYKEPTVWKVKCMMGHEKQSVFCLMQKYVELESLGRKLQIISACSIDHVKGFIYIEAETKSDINEACKGMSTVYSSRILPVPKNEVSSTLSVRSKCNEISIGSWARVKNGKYKGDLAQIITVNDTRKKATVKLIPRIDLQVLVEKYGGGGRSRKNVVPPPRFVTSTELEEFRPLIQCRRDRETGLAFEILDGMMLRDGYLYKKIKIDSLSFYGVMPSEAELLKFESSDNENPVCEDWLTELYGEKNKGLRVGEREIGGGREGEGSSSSSNETSFKIGDLVLFNWKDFGVILDLENEEYYKILKEGSEGPEVLSVDSRQLNKASFKNRFTALDKLKKIISVNDTVKVLEGPLEGRKGNVKRIYRGTIFFHDEVEQENNGYFCCKSQICKKIKLSDDDSKEKGCESLFPSSSESPLVLEKPRETRGRNNIFKKEDQQGFTVGQSLRIRTGSLKGYLCRCLAIRRADVTVKLDSQPKVLTVKYDNLVEVRGRSSAFPMRSSRPAFQSPGTSAQPESDSSMEIDKKDDEKSDVTRDQAGGWRNSEGNWGKPKTPLGDQAGWRSGGKNCGTKPSATGQGRFSQNAQANWGPSSKIAASSNAYSFFKKKKSNAYSTWGKKNKGNGGTNGASNWGKCVNAVDRGQAENWGKTHSNKDANSPGWGKTLNAGGGQVGNWANINTKNNYSTPAWSKTIEPPNNMKKGNSGPTWGRTVESPDFGQGGSWGKNTKNAENFTPAWGKTVETPKANQGGGRSSWVSKQRNQKEQNWDRTNSFNQGRGSGDRSGGRSFWAQQNGGGDQRNTYSGGRGGGFGERKGRGGMRGGGRGGRSRGGHAQRGERGGFRGGRGGGRGGRSFGVTDGQGGERAGRGVGRRGRGGSFGGGGRGRGRRYENSNWSNNERGGGGDKGKNCNPWSNGNEFGNSGGSNLGEQSSNLGVTFGLGRGSWNKKGPANGGRSPGWGTAKGPNGGRGSGGQWGKPSSKGGW